MTDIARIGLEVDSSQVKTASDRLDQLEASGKKADSAIDLFKKNWMQMTTAMAAGMAVYDTVLQTMKQIVGAVQDVVLQAARYNSMGVVMERVGRQAGYSSSQMHLFQKQLEQGGIAMTESRETLARMAMAHIDLTKAAQLSRLAQDAAVIANTNSSEAFARVVYGIQTAQPEILRTLGLTVNFHQEYQRLSITLNKNVKDLTETEKMQARLNAVLEKGKDIAGVYEDAMDTAGKQLSSLKRFQDNLAVSTGQLFQDVLLVAVRGYTDYLKDSIKTTNELADAGQIQEWGRNIAMTFAVVADVINDFVQGIKAAAILFGGLMKIMSSPREEWKDGFNFIKEELSKINSSFGKYTENAERLFAEVDKRSEQRKLKQQASDAEYVQKSLQVLKAYEKEAVAIQIAAQKALRDAYYPGSADPVQAPGKPDNSIANQQKEAIEGLRRELTMKKDATQVEKTLFEIRAGNYRNFNEQTKKELLQLSEAIDMRDRELKILERKKELEKDRLDVKAKDVEIQDDILNYLEDYEKKLQNEIALNGKSAEEKEKMNALFEIEKKWREEISKLSADFSEEEFTRLDLEYEKKKRNISLLLDQKIQGDKADAASKKAAEDYKRTWEGIFNTIDKAAENAFVNIFEGGRDVFKRLADTIKTTVLATLYQMVVRKWVINIVGAITGETGIAQQLLGAGVSSATGGAANGLLGTLGSSVMSWAGQTAWGGGISNAYTGFIAGYQGATLPAGVAGPTTAGSTGAMGAGNSAAGALGTVAWIAAIVAAMYANDQLFQRGWRQDNQDRTSDLIGGGFNHMTDRSFRALGMSDRLASVLSGSSMTARIFGHGAEHADAYGFSGTISGSGINAGAWQDMSRRGGVFRSDQRWTETTPLTEDQQDLIDDFRRGLTNVTDILADVVGPGGRTALAGYTRDFNVQLSENGEFKPEALGDLFASVLKEQVETMLRGSGEDKLADYIKNLKETGSELTKVITEFVQVMKGLDQLDLNGLNMQALMDWQKEGESIGQTFSRVADQWNFFQTNFLTDAQKIELGQKAVDSAFSKLGIAVPASKEEFFKLIKGIDLSTEAGRKLWDALAEVAPAFLVVADAAQQAKDAMKADWESLMGTIDNLTGNSDRTRGVLQGNLNTAISQFQAGNSWAAGMTPQAVIAALMTIQKDDFEGYSEENRKLIKAILELALGIKDLDDSVTQAAVAINPAYGGDVQGMTGNLMAGFDARFGEIIGARPHTMDQLGLRSTLMGQQVESWEARKKELEQQYGGTVDRVGEYQALIKAIQAFKDQISGPEGLTDDMARLTVLTAQYGEATGEQIFALEEWYEAQKKLFEGNSTALEALDTTFAERMREIMDGADDGFRDWAQSLLTGSGSPLDATTKLALAQKKYNDALASGDKDDFRTASDNLLALGMEFWSQSSPEFLAMFQKVLADAETLGGFTLDYSEGATSEDVTDLREAIVERVAEVEAAALATRLAIEAASLAASKEAQQTREENAKALEEMGRKISDAVLMRK